MAQERDGKLGMWDHTHSGKQVRPRFLGLMVRDVLSVEELEGSLTRAQTPRPYKSAKGQLIKWQVLNFWAHFSPES